MSETHDIQGSDERLADRAAADPGLVLALAFALYDRDRFLRSGAARALRLVAEREPSAVLLYVTDLVTALERPERSTRWESLGALEALSRGSSEGLSRVISAVGLALLDPYSRRIRRAALRVLAAIGGASEAGPGLVWPVVRDALAVYHGEPDYPAVLACAVALLEEAPGLGVGQRRLRALASLDAADPRPRVRRLAVRMRRIAEPRR